MFPVMAKTRKMAANRSLVKENPPLALLMPSSTNTFTSTGLNRWATNIPYVPSSNPPEVICGRQGIIILKMRQILEVHITVDGAVRIEDKNNDIAVTISNEGNCLSICHPQIQMVQNLDKAEITLTGVSKKRYIEIHGKVLFFSQEGSPATYKVDRTVTQVMKTLHTYLHNPTLPMFYFQSRHGIQYVPAVLDIIKNVVMYGNDGFNRDTFYISDIVVSQDQTGIARVSKTELFTIDYSPCGSITISTKSIKLSVENVANRITNIKMNSFRVVNSSNSLNVTDKYNNVGFHDGEFTYFQI